MKIELGQVQKMLEWLKTKLYLDSIAQNARSRAIKEDRYIVAISAVELEVKCKRRGQRLLFKMTLLTPVLVTLL